MEEFRFHAYMLELTLDSRKSVTEGKYTCIGFETIRRGKDHVYSNARI